MSETRNWTAIERRMASGDTFTLAQLSRLGNPTAGQMYDRVADRAMQKWRRLGWIDFKREGRVPVWHLTDAGRAALLKARSTEVPSGEE
jgi:hypothetical protein